MKKILRLILLLILASLFACSASNSQNTMYSGSDGISYETSDESSNSGYVDLSSYDEDNKSFNGEKITYSADISLETRDYDSSYASLKEKINKYNCLISSSNETDYDNYWWDTSSRTSGVRGRIVNLYLRVPVSNFDAFLKDVDNIGAHVKSINVSSSNQTKTYNSNSLRITELEVQQQRLTELLSQASNVTEILEIEDRLSEVRYQLKMLNENNHQIDYDVEYSQIYISLREVDNYTQENYMFMDRLSDALSSSFMNFVYWLEDAFIFLIYAIPYIILIVIIVFIINYIRKKRGKDKLSLKNIFKRKKKETKEN